MGFGTAQQTTTTGAVFMPDVWAKEVELARESAKVMPDTVNRRDADVKNGGNLLEVPFVSNLNANAVSDNTAVTFQAPTETKVQISINRHYESSVAIQDRLATQAAYQLAKDYQEKTGEALARQVDTDLTGTYTSATQTVGTGLASVTEANIVRAIQYLNDANAPLSNRYFTMKPGTMQQIQQIARFTEYQTVGDTNAPMRGGNNGLVGDVFGVEVRMTTDIAQVSGTPGTVHNLLYHRDFACLVMQRDITLEVARRPDFLATGYTASAIWGYTVLRTDHVVDVRVVINT